MSNGTLRQLVDSMSPTEALDQMAVEIRRLFSLLREDARINFLVRLMAGSPQDKESSLVHLWMATCMVEGIDPVRMCRMLMGKMAESEQLKSEADPGILVLFQDWLEQLEEEAMKVVERTGSINPIRLADELGLSESGGVFLVARLKQKGKL